MLSHSAVRIAEVVILHLHGVSQMQCDVCTNRGTGYLDFPDACSIMFNAAGTSLVLQLLILAHTMWYIPHRHELRHL